MAQTDTGITTKITGNTFSAAEFNLVNNAINNNASDVTSRIIPNITFNSLADVQQFKNGIFYDIPEGNYTIGEAFTWDFPWRMVTTNGIYKIQGATFNRQITYNGTASFFQTNTTGVTIDFRNTFISTPNATTIEGTDFNSVIMYFPVFVGCQKVMEITDTGFLTVDRFVMVGCADGAECINVGKSVIGVGQWTSGLDTGGTAFTFSGVNSKRVVMTECDAEPAATETFIKFDNNFGTSVNGSVSILGGTYVTGLGPFYDATGRDGTDPRIIASHITGVVASMATAYGSFDANAAVTTITTVDTPVQVVGTVVASDMERFTHAASVFTYTGIEAGDLMVHSVLTVDIAGGGTKTVSSYITKNGVVVANTKGSASMSVDSQLVSISRIPMVTGDTLEVFIENNTDTTNLTVKTFSFSIGS